MAAQAAAKSCRLGALIGNSWRRTLHSSRPVNTGGSVRDPAAVSPQDFHLSRNAAGCSPAPLRHAQPGKPELLGPPRDFKQKECFATGAGGGRTGRDVALLFLVGFGSVVWFFFWRGWGNGTTQLKDRFCPPCSYSVFQKLCLKPLASLRISARTRLGGTYVSAMHTHP